jgi:hypothetical protein
MKHPLMIKGKKQEMLSSEPLFKSLYPDALIFYLHSGPFAVV